ncbi:MAG: non-canonical purine NTP diphosphatase [Bacteroidetes bacterium]|nr:non-canonical purine NTP diphosphatase [Bacteroidota bacterium]
MNLVFATQNRNKAAEIQKMVPAGITVQTLQDIQCNDDIAETGSTLEENALLKARYIYNKFGVNCFADDTGLEVEALQGRPGVLSARYAGESKDAGDNMNLVLEQLLHESNRKARFRTVIALILDGKEHLFEGIVNGYITVSMSGTGGFGYDPIFKPEGFEGTFAEMTADEKNKISHRGLAVNALIGFLKTHTNHP